MVISSSTQCCPADGRPQSARCRRTFVMRAGLRKSDPGFGPAVGPSGALLDGRKGWRAGRSNRAVWAALRQLDRVLASVPTRQSVWPDNGSQRLGRIIGQFDPDALLTPVFDY